MVLVSLIVSPAFACAEAGDKVSSSSSPFVKCLPAEIKPDDVVEASNARDANGRAIGLRKVTVDQKLQELNATCSAANKLVDGNGKEIVFYHLAGCWGNPPADYQEILQKQREEISKLKQQYTVIEMTCNPSGVPFF